jgi:hypothetical protein
MGKKSFTVGMVDEGIINRFIALKAGFGKSENVPNWAKLHGKITAESLLTILISLGEEQVEKENKR